MTPLYTNAITITPPDTTMGDFAFGAAGLVGAAAIGAGLGAALNRPCPPPAQQGYADIGCGPAWGAAGGAAYGLAAGTVGGLVVAVLSERWRRPALAASGIGFGLAVIGSLQKSIKPSTR